MTKFSADEVIALCTLAVALLAFLVSWRSHVVAKRAFDLADADHRDRRKGVTAYLINAYKQRADGAQYCFFAVSFTNRASIANSLSSVHLEIEFSDDRGRIGKVKVRPADTKTMQWGTDLEVLRIPHRLESRETVQGLITFPIPPNENLGTSIEAYRLHAKLATNETVLIRSFLVNEIECAED